MKCAIAITNQLQLKQLYELNYILHNKAIYDAADSSLASFFHVDILYFLCPGQDCIRVLFCVFFTTHCKKAGQTYIHRAHI